MLSIVLFFKRSALTGRNHTNQFKSDKSLFFFIIAICLICKDLKTTGKSCLKPVVIIFILP